MKLVEVSDKDREKELKMYNNNQSQECDEEKLLENFYSYFHLPTLWFLSVDSIKICTISV